MPVLSWTPGGPSPPLPRGSWGLEAHWSLWVTEIRSCSYEVGVFFFFFSLENHLNFVIHSNSAYRFLCLLSLWVGNVISFPNAMENYLQVMNGKIATKMASKLIHEKSDQKEASGSRLRTACRGSGQRGSCFVTVGLVHQPLHLSSCPADVGAVSLHQPCQPPDQRSKSYPGIAWTEVQAAGSQGVSSQALLFLRHWKRRTRPI